MSYEQTTSAATEYSKVRHLRGEIHDTIALVQAHERAELWRAVDALDAWLDHHKQWAIISRGVA